MPSTIAPTPPAPRTGTVLRRRVLPLAAAALALSVLVVVRWAPLMSADLSVDRAFHRWALAHPGATHVNRVLTDWVWDPWVMRLLAALAVLYLLLRGSRWDAVRVAVAVVAANLLQQGLKAAVGRPRPHWSHPVDSAHYAAYPSGHAMTAAVVCGLLLWLLRRRLPHGGPVWRAALAVAAISVLGVGLTRIWLGVHWPSDVLGGWLLGALIVTATAATAPRGR
ncbi:phosphatase PAP2 family protein [Streptomyces sp. NPDC058045]|uniref:phosphatase PAP2 family protein n=1 Tax=Streptomyces sp. NPDC058045 TaxID=3346311 RepID=UPI0036E089AF